MTDLTKLSDSQLLALAQQHIGPSAAEQVANDAITQGAMHPEAGMSTLERFNAGVGKAFSDVGHGIAQLVGMGPSAEQVRETRRLDAPLMSTGAGVAGDIAGNLSLLAPTALIPGAAAVPAAGALGASLAAVQPTETPTERLKNMGIGLLLGGGGQYLGTTGARAIGEYAAKRAAERAATQAQNSVRDAALAAGRKAGYVVPPSTINPSLTNQAVESLGGKVATQQQASVANQKVTDTLARRAIGLKADAPVTESTLSHMRSNEGAAYDAIKNVPGRFNSDKQFAQDVAGIGSDLSHAAQDFPSSTKNAAIEALNSDLKIGSYTPRGVVEKIKLLRSDAAANFRAYNDPEKLALARAQRQAADALDGLVERNLAAQGKRQLALNYRAARTNIARLHDLEAAFTPGGHFDARVLAKIGERSPLSGDLQTIADFAGNFGKAVQTGEKIGSPMVHALRPSIGTGIGAMLGGIPGGAVGAATGIAAPYAARGAMLSGPGQALLATPNYSGGILAALDRSGLLPSPQLGGILAQTVAPAAYVGAKQSQKKGSAKR